MSEVPVIDVAPLVTGEGDADASARRIDAACRAHGFFYVRGHGVDASLVQRLERLAQAFFALDEPTKMRWRMALGGSAWRGYFPLGGELTSGRPDWKEGFYFGEELAADHPLVRAGTPVHGPNLFPDHPGVPGLRDAVLDYMAAMTRLAHAVMEGIARGLGLPPDYFALRYTAEPLVLFRIFNYPSRPVPEGTDAQWGVGEHTDYGLLTLLWQDEVGGLQVKTREGWIEAPPLADTFVCNIGDMLDRMTGGLYRSTPHRVRINTSGRDRLSFPFFFDPSFEARVQPIEHLGPAADDSDSRWDGSNLHAFDGRYGDYLLRKVGKVFPQLREQVIDKARP